MYIYTMKKLLTTTAIILSLNCVAQDTTYYQQRNDLYMKIRVHVTDSIIYKQYYSVKLEKERRKNIRMSIVLGAIFAGISAWYWGK